MTALDGAVALVTGGASGIGRATALAFAGRGARLVVVDLDVDGAEAVATEIRSVGGRRSRWRATSRPAGPSSGCATSRWPRSGRSTS